MLAASLSVSQTSSIYETEPWGHIQQPPFLNMVCRGQALVSPEELLKLCKAVELLVGRQPTFRYGPRVLDIDILDYGGRAMSTPELEVPHPRLAERAFVLVPLAEIAPGWAHPATGERISELLKAAAGTKGVKLWRGPLSVPERD